MIDLITSANANENLALVREMHRHRHRVFRDRMGWDVSSDGGEEYDEFDRPDTVYLIVSDETGQVTGSWRLLATETPYMLSTVFRDLFGEETPPQARDVWECSRFAVEAQGAPEAGGIDSVTAQLLTGITEFAVTYGIREIVTATDVAVGRLMQRALEMKPVWRGPVRPLGNTRAFAGRYAISGTLLERLRAKFSVPVPIVRQFAILPMAA